MPDMYENTSLFDFCSCFIYILARNSMHASRRGLTMYNNRLDGLTEYPFQRLAALLNGFEPGAAPINMGIGEPQHAPPALLHAALAKSASDWRKYPPTAGTPVYRAAVTAWCTRRYELPANFLDPEKHVLPVAGTREGLFMAAQ